MIRGLIYTDRVGGSNGNLGLLELIDGRSYEFSVDEVCVHGT
jgi:hypothetical protein